MPRTTIECHPSGTYFDFADPKPEMVHVEDIARALSYTARFGGHTSRFYSVAEHALLVSRLVREAGHGPELQFAALHHDSAEAYLGDIPRPLKVELGGSYSYFTVLAEDAIAESFNFDPAAFHLREVKDADEHALAIEATVLKRSRTASLRHGTTKPVDDIPHGAVPVECEPSWAEHLFLAAHHRLGCDVAMARLGASS